MNITNKGAHYEYIPQHEVHKSRNFAIGLSGIDLTSADGFAYSLGRSIAAAATSAGVGIAASEAGMGGFVASLAASMAGAAMNMATQDRPGPGLGSNGNVSYSRNGKGFKAISVEFDQAEFNRVIDGIKAKVFGQALDEEMSVPEAVETAEQEVEQFVEEIEAEQAKVEETAEMISKNDESLKIEASQTDSNKKKALLLNAIERINKKQAEVAVKTAETLVQEAAQQTELELLAVAKQRYFENLRELEHQRKLQKADEVVHSHKILIWSQLDDPNCVQLSDIKIENEKEVRAAAEKDVAKEFKHYRDIVEADFCAQCRFLKGEGYIESVPKEIEQDLKAPAFVREINSAKNRLERLRQEERGKIGENYAQRIAKMVPLLGSYIDYRYDPDASLGDFGKSLGIEVALLAMPMPGGGTIKAVGKVAKSAATIEKVAGTALKTAGKSEIGAVAGKAAVVKAETAIANKAANDVFLKNVEKNVLEKEASKAVDTSSFNLTRYGGPGGGHHIHMKKAYESHPLYDLNEALCLSNEEMTRLGIQHSVVSKEQRKLCARLKQEGKSMTREEMNRISVEALVAGGADRQLARDIVAKSQWNLHDKGVRNPTDMPWGKKGKNKK